MELARIQKQEALREANRKKALELLRSMQAALTRNTVTKIERT